MPVRRLAVFSDFPEEKWLSMDLCAGMLVYHLHREQSNQLQVQRLCPPFQWRWGQVPGLRHRRIAYNGDRLLNRFWDYPQFVRSQRHQFDGFHVADHSYAQLVHALEPARTGVFCHDIDAFRCLIDPVAEPRPVWFRAMSRHILQGLQRAAVVFYSTQAVRDQLIQHHLVQGDRLVHAPYGIEPEFFHIETALSEGDRAILKQVGTKPFLLHVGSCIPRKRVDVLLEVFAAVRQAMPVLKLVKVGGEWSADQQSQIQHHALQENIIHLTGLQRSTLAALYRRAALVLQPSQAEGFGLPVIEALACGAIALISDIPVLKEVGGDAVVYAPVADVSAWIERTLFLLQSPHQAPPVEKRLSHAQRYSWSTHAQIIADTYRQL
mgnify:CR=1 FL=1